MKIRIRHRTIYNYRMPVTFGQHRVMVRPREGHDLHIESSILEIHPSHSIHWMRDVNNNSIAKLDFLEPSAQLMIHSELVLQHYDANPLDFILDQEAAHYPFNYDAHTLPELTAFTQILYPRDEAEVRAWLTQFWQPGTKVETIALLQEVNRQIRDRFEYRRRDEQGVQTPAETLQKKSGSCRDFATLLLESYRCWGLAARFVSGYMQGEATEAGGASTHAWTEVYLPGAGWKGFDPTSGIMTAGQHVTVAVARDPQNAAPISGSFIGLHNAFLNILVDVVVAREDKISEMPLETTATLPVALLTRPALLPNPFEMNPSAPALGGGAL